MEDVLVYGLAGIAVLLIYIKALDSKRLRLDSIPAVGPSGILSSYIGAIRFVVKGHEMVQEGYHKYHSKMFRVPLIDKWIVVLSGSKLVDDVRQSREEDLSFVEAVSDSMQVKYTLGQASQDNPYHAEVIRSQLTRNLGSRFCDIRDEIEIAFDETLPPLSENEWTSVHAMDAIMNVVCRTSNRLFVGLPLCRDPDYMKLNIQFTIEVAMAAQGINLFPDILKPMIGPILSPLSRNTKRATKHLRPIIEERLMKEEQYGKDWPGKPNDLISWLLEVATGEQRTISDIVMRILIINFAAIHTSSLTFTQALYDLAVHPEYAQPMRDEVDAVVEEEGWTKNSMSKMRKIDSFLRESQRFHGLSSLNMDRKVVKPGGYTFSDGTTLPVGTYLTVAARSIHHDEGCYENPEVFDGFRFARMREADGEGVKYQMVNTSPVFLPFGHGRHACPGRFFAANELKAMLAHVVSAFDVRLQDGVRPVDQWFGNNCVPNRHAQVMFRRRQA